MKRKILIFCSLIFALLLIVFLIRRFVRQSPYPTPRPRLTRPYGMAPVAFRAFLQACRAAQIHPYRIAQTIGDAPRSKGYHFRDGVVGGQDYSTAVDLGVDDLSQHKRAEFLEAMARVGFASWFRTGPRWKNQEHVHAVYAGLPMKPQLRAQIRLWNHERRESKRKPLRWQRSWRRNFAF